MNEADTCHKYVVPALQSAGWDDAPHRITKKCLLFPSYPLTDKSSRYYQEIAVNRTIQKVLKKGWEAARA